jgi:hypothetical protein
MSKKFKDPIKPRKHDLPEEPPFSLGYTFKTTSYDNRGSAGVNAGTNYGVGFNQPVGKYTASAVGDVPFDMTRTTIINEKV